jgi:hypothetical protein
MIANITPTPTCHQAQPSSGLLDRDRQRQGRQRGPQQPEAERRPDLGVGADAGRVVVGRAGHDPRAEPLEVAMATQQATMRMMLKLPGAQSDRLHRQAHPRASWSA